MTFSPIDCSFKVVQVNITPNAFEIILNDGRIIPTPRATFKRLAQATDEELKLWHIDQLGIGIHWEALNEDLLIYPLLKDAEENGRIRYATP
jgi:hypothetical protein